MLSQCYLQEIFAPISKSLRNSAYVQQVQETRVKKLKSMADDIEAFEYIRGMEPVEKVFLKVTSNSSC